jgi:hypothetical protein
MKNNLFLNIFCLSLLFQPFSKAVEIPAKATFVSVQATGVIPIADQSVLVLPCAPINANCKEAVEYLTKVVQGSQNLNPVQMQELNQKIRAALYSLRQIEEARTDLKGEVKIPCKAANCLIYTNWTSNENSLFWINLHKSGTMQEYPPSRAIQVKNLRVPEEIIKLNDSISRLKAQLSAGMSYVNLSSSVSPFIQGEHPTLAKRLRNIAFARKARIVSTELNGQPNHECSTDQTPTSLCSRDFRDSVPEYPKRRTDNPRGH